MTGPEIAKPGRRARRSFWILVLVSVLAAGELSAALASVPGPATGQRVAGSALVLTVTVGLAARVLLAIERANARAGRRQHPTAGAPDAS